MERFRKAMGVAEEEFIQQVRGGLLGAIQTREIVKEAYEKRKEEDGSGEIVVLRKFVPWQSSIFQLEREGGKVGEVKFVIFPEKGSKGWRVQGVPAAEGSFSLRKGRICDLT